MEKILLIDDNVSALDILKIILEGEGFNVSTAISGEMGIEKAKDIKPDLVILDIGLPGLDGFEVCRLLKNDPETKNIMVILVTGRDRSDDFEKAKTNKADGFIVKPYEIQDLLNEMKKFIR
jgi:DNA-binding response OmpR family regulator